MSHIVPPNHTQIPNLILGDILKGNIVSPGLMAKLEGSQLKVLLAVCRLTFGFHQKQRRASLKMIEQMTGLSRPGVVNAANRLEELELIERFQDGGVTLWKIVVNSVNQEEKEAVNSVNQAVNSVNQGSKLILPPSKKETRKKLKKETKRDPPAIQIFIGITGHHKITTYWRKKMTSSVGEERPQLELWAAVIKAWSGCGWKVGNIKGQLEYFERGEIPGERNGANQNERRKQEPTPDWVQKYSKVLG